MNAPAPGWVAWPHGRPGPVRRTRDAVHVCPLFGRAAHDAQPVRRRGPRAGDVPARLPRVRWVQGRHQPQGLALQDPDQHLHQLVPGEEASPRRGRPRRHRGLLPVPPPRRARGGGGGPHPRDRGAREHPRRGGEGGARGAAGAVPDGRAARRRRRLLLQGDRRDHGCAHRHGHEPAAPWKKAAPGAVVGLRSRTRPDPDGAGAGDPKPPVTRGDRAPPWTATRRSTGSTATSTAS